MVDSDSSISDSEVKKKLPPDTILQDNKKNKNNAILTLTKRQFTFKERNRKVISLIKFSIVSILSGALITETYLILLTNRFSTEHLIYFLTLIPSYIFLRNMKTNQRVNQVLDDGTILTENIINPMKSIFAKIVMYSLFCVLIQMIIICFLNYLYSTLLVLICCIPILLVISFVEEKKKQRQQQQRQKQRVIQRRQKHKRQRQKFSSIISNASSNKSKMSFVPFTRTQQQQQRESDDSGSSDLEVFSVRSTQSNLEYLK